MLLCVVGAMDVILKILMQDMHGQYEVIFPCTEYRIPIYTKLIVLQINCLAVEIYYHYSFCKILVFMEMF